MGVAIVVALVLWSMVVVLLLGSDPWNGRSQDSSQGVDHVVGIDSFQQPAQVREATVGAVAVDVDGVGAAAVLLVDVALGPDLDLRSLQVSPAQELDPRLRGRLGPENAKALR